MSDTVGAEGAHPYSFNGQPPTVAGYNAPGDNIVQRVDVTRIANDKPNDNDYDDEPGPTKTTSSGFNPVVPS